MSAFDDFLKLFPPDVQSTVRVIWDALGPGEKTKFIDLISSFPSESNLVKGLVKLSTTQIRQSFGRKQKVAIIGPANVVKSTLYNQMIHSKEDHAEVSPLPGTTRETQQADAGLFTVVDTPGADSVGTLGEHEQQLALSAASQADFLVIMVDAIQGVKKTEQEIFHQLTALKRPYIVVMNKIDLVRSKEVDGVVSQAAANLGLQPSQVIPIVAKNGKNLGRVLLAIASTEPEMVAALGQALPQYRWQLAWPSIVGAASLSAAIALTPLPVIDFIPLVITQSVMVLGIARIYNYQITPKRANELVATFGLGFLARTIFQELSKLGGIPGWLLSAAIASSTTVVMGYAATRWFENGEKLSTEALKHMTEEITKYMLDTLKSFGKRKPSKEELQERIVQTLDATSLATTQKQLDDEAQKKSE